jgi:uncharacterized membrane protein
MVYCDVIGLNWHKIFSKPINMNSTSLDFQSYLEDYASLIGLVLFLVIVDIILKLIVLWQSSRRKQIAWFIVLALVNSLGILPVVYLILNRYKDKFKH